MQPAPSTLLDMQIDPLVGFFAVFEDSPIVAQGTLAKYGWLGVELPSASQALKGSADGSWGIGAASTDMDATDRLSEPYAAVETVRAFDVQRCITVDSSLIVPEGVAFELVHQTTPAGSIGVVEDYPTIFAEVTALDGDGNAVFTYGNLNGSELCTNELVHPDPMVTEPLRWRFQLDYINIAYLRGIDLRYVGGVPAAEMGGKAIIPAWNDLRSGSNNRWAEGKQCLVPASSLVRIWIELTGPMDRFDVRVGARLGGFWQFGGRLGAALNNATIRRT